jgi:hypothetical protein
MTTQLDIRTKTISLIKDDSSRLSVYTGVTTFANSTSYTLNARIKPASYTGRTYKCTTAGTSQVSGTPTYPTAEGSTFTSGNATFTEDSDDIDLAILAALSLFNNIFPKEKVASISGTGTNTYSVPTDWINEFSSLLKIEYTVGNVPATYLLEDEFEVYLDISGSYKIRLLTVSPTDAFYITYTIPRLTTEVQDSFVEPFVWLCASLCLNKMAQSYLQTSDSSIDIDSVDYKTKSKECVDRAKTLRDMYLDFVGATDGKAALAFTRIEKDYPYGIQRLTHPRIWRLTR